MADKDPYKLNPVVRTSIKDGLITDGAIGENDMPMTAVRRSLNFHFDAIGAATLRKGQTAIGNVLGGTSLGLYQFINPSDATKNQLIYVNNATAYYLSGGSWASKRTGLTNGSKARFSPFLNYVFMVNGTEATAIWDGNPANSFVTTGNASGAPTGQFIDNFRSRMWIAGNSTYPDRLFYSSIPSADTTQLITWDSDPTTGQWIDISPSDGEHISAIHRSKNSLLVFKPNHIYKVYSVNSTDPDPTINVGTYSSESIVETKIGVFFHHSSGFYTINAYGIPVEISRPIIDIIRNISYTNYASICGSLDKEGDHITWEVGTVTINGVTFSNLAVRYTISTQVWTHYAYPTQFLQSTNYTDGTNLFRLVSDTTGTVLKLDTGTDDNGTPIVYELIHPVDTLDGARSTTKNITKTFFLHQQGTGSKVSFRNESDPPEDFSKNICQLQAYDTGSKTLFKCKKLQIKVQGVSTGQPFIYRGYEILEGTVELVTFPNASA